MNYNVQGFEKYMIAFVPPNGNKCLILGSGPMDYYSWVFKFCCRTIVCILQRNWFVHEKVASSIVLSYRFNGLIFFFHINVWPGSGYKLALLP